MMTGVATSPSEVEPETSSLVSWSPAPAWADVPSALPKIHPSPEQSFAGRAAWLSDSQVNLLGAQPIWLSRTVYEVTSPDGLQAAGNINVDFDPGFQTLVFHHVRVVRGEAAREIDPTIGLEVLRRERDLERAVFDGRLTAHVSISDVRVGDIVDVCHSIAGGHPILGGKVFAEWVLNWACWVGETRVRLIAAADRNLAIQTANGAPDCEIDQTSVGDTIRTWRSMMTPPLTTEPYSPVGLRPQTRVRVCDVLSWPEVAETFCDYYGPEPLPDELEAAVKQIEEKAVDYAERAIKALHLVQGGLRYQAITLGSGGFVPRPLEQIWSSRTGDCKDSSRLLVAILRRLGIAAEPVLVNTQHGADLKGEAPSLVVFNHCIVGLTVDGQRYWLDPTVFPQGGRLAVVRQARFGYGLPLRADAELEDIGDDQLAESFHVNHVYELPAKVDGPGRLEVKTTLFGWRADVVRRNLAAGLASYTQKLMAGYERRFGTAALLEPIHVDDDLDLNRLEMVLKIELGRVWQSAPDGRAVFQPDDEFFQPNIPDVSPDGRRFPIALGLPLSARSHIELRLPAQIKVNEWDTGFDAPGLKAHSKHLAINEKPMVVALERSLIIDRSVVAPEDAPALADFRQNVLGKGSLAIRMPVKNGVITPGRPAKKPVNPGQIVFLAILGAWVILGILGSCSRMMEAGSGGHVGAGSAPFSAEPSPAASSADNWMFNPSSNRSPALPSQ
jgi:Domain of Unknown Function with PDB structure (DUF3857)/Transglutaminase-like superfamily